VPLQRRHCRGCRDPCYSPCWAILAALARLHRLAKSNQRAALSYGGASHCGAGAGLPAGRVFTELRRQLRKDDQRSPDCGIAIERRSADYRVLRHRNALPRASTLAPALKGAARYTARFFDVISQQRGSLRRAFFDPRDGAVRMFRAARAACAPGSGGAFSPPPARCRPQGGSHKAVGPPVRFGRTPGSAAKPAGRTKRFLGLTRVSPEAPLAGCRLHFG
jgi:hypothetical protein